jgi:hypothetical protein
MKIKAMTKTLMFSINGSGFSAGSVKIEWKKLCGYSKTFAYDIIQTVPVGQILLFSS